MELFDLHCDTLCEALDNKYSLTKNSGAIDLDRATEYRPWVQTFAAWLSDDADAITSRRRCEALLSLANAWEEQQFISVIRSAADLVAPCSRCAALLSVENGGALDADEEYLCKLYRLGVRLITLTWNGDNHWGCGSFGSGGGLTDAGRRALATMERIGIVTDVSHLNEVGFWQVASMATRPFVATHSASAAVYPHCRNLTDDQFRAVRDSGGVVGLCLYPEHLGGDDFSIIRRHLEHYIELDGAQTVCFGADFDGMTAPAKWNGISLMKEMRQYLLDCGWSRELTDAVFYNNARDFFLRYWKQTIRNEE